MSKKTILIVSGFGAQNIGNAFFNIGGMHIVKQIFPNHNVQFIQDQPGYWTFNRKRINNANDWGLLSKLDIEYIVLQGPVFSLALPKLWDETLSALYSRGGKVIYISAAFFRHTAEEVKATKDFLKKYPPAILSTRDTETFEELRGLCETSYDGICSAWFVPEVYEAPKILEQYVVANFDRWAEPRFSEVNNNALSDFSSECIATDIGPIKISRSKLLDRLSNRGKATAYISAAIDFRTLPNELYGLPVVRPEHRSNPYMGWKIYKRKNGFVSDEPFSYFCAYANSTLTLTDRVHACLMTLAYGRPAMLFTSSPRSRLFDRLKLSTLKSKPTTIDFALLEDEKKNQIDFLRNIGLSLVEN